MESGRPKLLLATDNPAKVREYSALLAGIPFVLTTPAEEGLLLGVKETGATFRENALLKATTYAKVSGLLALADDSGLEVDALGGEPGVFAKRYAGEGATDPQRNAYLLSKLEGVPWEKRTARFRCIIAIVSSLGKFELFEGEREGIIAFEPKGNYGFGYDPVFYLPEFGKTMAELPPETKNKISHRAQAAAKARQFLQQLKDNDPESLPFSGAMV